MELKDNRAPIHNPRGKFRPNWASPYIIKSIWSRRAIILMDPDGLEFSQPINMDKLKKYYCGEVVWKYSSDPGRRQWSSASHLKGHKHSGRGCQN
ncbi:hypothetical protein ACSBR1_029958 [Camellia fascicularis]